jgi:hypothetical protein
MILNKWQHVLKAKKLPFFAKFTICRIVLKNKSDHLRPRTTFVEYMLVSLIQRSSSIIILYLEQRTHYGNQLQKIMQKFRSIR